LSFIEFLAWYIIGIEENTKKSLVKDNNRRAKMVNLDLMLK